MVMICVALPAAADINGRPQREQTFDDNYVEAFKLFTEQATNVMLSQLPIIGALLDAKHQLETQRIFGEAAAEAHRDYSPTEQVCDFGSLARTTAASKFKVDDNASVMNTILQKRDTLNANSASSWGPFSDFGARMGKYKTVYCDPNDDNGQIRLSGLCTSPDSVRRNKDIDYRRTISSYMTLDLNFTDANSTPDEEDVMALAKNLYAHEIISPIPETAMAPYGTYRELQDSRMLSAVRSVARDSYTAIAASKAAGSGLNSVQLRQIMQNLGVPAADLDKLIGVNPSYFAQMEIITQKMYQDPNFYASLYVNPANVARMKVVLQAVRLMADRDRFEEGLRREMLISMLLEMRLREAQDLLSGKTSKAKGALKE